MKRLGAVLLLAGIAGFFFGGRVARSFPDRGRAVRRAVQPEPDALPWESLGVAVFGAVLILVPDNPR